METGVGLMRGLAAVLAVGLVLDNEACSLIVS